MTDNSPDRPSPQPEPMRSARDRLQEVLADAPGSHLVYALPPRLAVLSYRGQILGLPGTDSEDVHTIDIARQSLATAGIKAKVVRCAANPANPGVRTYLASAEDADRLIRLVLDQMPKATLVARGLSRALTEHRCVYADKVEAREGWVWGLQLTLNDVRKVFVAVGEGDEDLHAYGVELYALADRLARLLRNRLGGERVEVSAYPSRGALCDTCHEEILRVEPLSADQAEALTVALTRTMRGAL
ncbi:hypothetical protein ACFW6S_04305 [Streptomyces sp. NPDC058740]|uniref:hypothetical protein n=1 Tax=Streptomyces sp. NPDC058740 TaxID=3346619 RepID=UPI00369A6C68